MANDLRQALKWLIEGKKIRNSRWFYGAYIVIRGSDIRDEKGEYCADSLNGCDQSEWELFGEPTPEPVQDAFKDALIDCEDYRVWDKKGHNTFAWYCEDDDCFYELKSNSYFALAVADYKILPKKSS